MRTFAVIGFIVFVAAAALVAATRPTIARGEVLAADLLHSNPGVLQAMRCDAEVPIGVDGADFWCDATFTHGGGRRLHFQMARTGVIKQIGDDPRKETSAVPVQRIDKSDPWE
ncbi:MAG: hypothetical protein ABI678_02420 [Kofleriaceae bacterium]